MAQPLYQQLQNLKSAMLSLSATGEAGFEGLIGVILREICGVPFRLAASGSQLGVDGKQTYEGDAVCFEGKRYDDTVPKNEVLSKIVELSISGAEIDIWVLGATSQIRTQLVDLVRKVGARNGISVVILDWSDMDLPPFAVALAMGGTRVQEFLEKNVSDGYMLQNALVALETVAKSPGFSLHAERIRAECNQPAAGYVLAQKANAKWLTDTFCSKRRARLRLGQPLSPGDANDTHVQARETLTSQLSLELTTVSDKPIVIVLGGEGYGKSWLVAQVWLKLVRKPLMVFMTPDDFTENAGLDDMENLLISKLIVQTEADPTESTRERWRRRLRQWRARQVTDGPRLIVVIDGINQRPRSDWARIIDRMGEELILFGGRLIVTSRTLYFDGHVRNRLTLLGAEIIVPEWTEIERDQMLAEYGLRASDLHHAVKRSLCNPRLMGIALELFNKADVASFEELSVSYLLFEHMRMSERDAPSPQPAREFARRLQKHAQEMISRVKAEQTEDINVFEEDMGAVADGCFYQETYGDPMHYSLKDDGLTLALGLCLIDRLCTAQRNNRSLDEELEAILEPIMALDDVAEVILAALTVAVLDGNYEHDIARTLVKGYAILQNPDQTRFPAFASLARRRPQGFMDAARDICLAGGRQPNFDWVQDALIWASRHGHTWQKMSERVHSWLSSYSLSPERGCFSQPGRESEERVREEREVHRKRIDRALCALSRNETVIFGKLIEEQGDLSLLSRLALRLLAGKPLAPFARSLVAWCFSYSLNSDHTSPYNDLLHLVSLNKVDWGQARSALLEESLPLRETAVSETGKWALVTVLRATGHSSDGKEAICLIEDLTKDRPCFEGWRLVESYCAADPCDPTSRQPENLLQTAEQYAVIDVGSLCKSRSQSREDLFLDMARPAMARFKPDVAVMKHRELILDVLRRDGLFLRQGLLEIHQHNALLTPEGSCEFLRKRVELRHTDRTGGLLAPDEWVISLYCLLLAFPFLAGEQQVNILLSDEADEDVLLNALELAKSLSQREFESLLKTICAGDNQRKQFLLLAFARHTSMPPLSMDARLDIWTLFQSESKHIRAQALAVIAKSNDDELIDQVSDSGWKAPDDTPLWDDFLEAWYGSLVLLKAAAKGIIPHDKVLDRISAHLYGQAAEILDASAVREIARRIDSSIGRVIGLQDNFLAPQIEIYVRQPDPYEPNIFALNERSTAHNNIKDAMDHLFESDEAFEQRQTRNRNAFREFVANLTDSRARIVLDYMTLPQLEAVTTATKEAAVHWYDLFMNVEETKLPALHNFVLLLACALARIDAKKANELFSRVKDSKPLVRFIIGKAGVELDHMAIWASAESPILDQLCFARLDQAGSDHDLSVQVLAALLSGRQHVLTRYVEAKLNKDEPAEISRGIMVAGFSDQSELNGRILKSYEGSAGLIGSAYKAAKYAYERNSWARSWFREMCQTDNNTDFWRFAVLFLKIVDGRFEVWGSDYKQNNAPIRSFRSTIENRLKSRFKRWESHRKSKLFGSDLPEPIFLQSPGITD